MHRFHPTSYGVGFLEVRFVKMAVCLRNKPQKSGDLFQILAFCRRLYHYVGQM